jgi:hypothetical protein
MFGMALIRSTRALAWELRTYWARGWRVSLTVAGDEERLEGHVSAVSATDAFTVVSGVHVPLEAVLAVHRPSRLGDSTYVEGEAWRGRIPGAARRDPNQLAIDGL